VVSAFNNSNARPEVQSLWPAMLVDAAAEDLTAQVIVKGRTTMACVCDRATRCVLRGEDELEGSPFTKDKPPHSC
jgi:hypothetical protein